MLREGMESGVGGGSGVEWMCGKLWYQDNGPGLADDRFPRPQEFKFTNHEGDLPPTDRP